MASITFLSGARSSTLRPRQVLEAALRAARLMLARSRERATLGELDAHALRDLGITPYEAGIEARKPFWRA